MKLWLDLNKLIDTPIIDINFSTLNFGDKQLIFKMQNFMV